jgi:hypothetical protein
MAPLQKQFTLYTSLMSKHSECFRAVRSPEWLARSGDPTRPVDFHDHDPEAFEAYLNCLMGGVQAVKADVEDEVPESAKKADEYASYIANPTDYQGAPPANPWAQPLNDSREEPELPEDAFSWTQQGCERRCAEGQKEPSAYDNACSDQLLCLAKIYVEADKLQDLGTANLVIDELIRFGSAKGYNPDDEVVNFVYQSTVHGNSLRKLMRDYYLYSTSSKEYMYLTTHQSDLPGEFYRDLYVEYLRVMRPAQDEYTSSFSYRPDLPFNSVHDKLIIDCCEYHQHCEKRLPKDKCPCRNSRYELDLRDPKDPSQWD